MVWHGGISGSAPIKIAEEGHFLSDTIGVISQADTIFSNMNICVSLLLIIILPIVMYYLGLKSKDSNWLCPFGFWSPTDVTKQTK